MAQLSCPICAKRFDSALAPSAPFCSERCRQIDLGRWLSERYTVPHVCEATDPEELASPMPEAPDHGPPC